jgi:putative transposase
VRRLRELALARPRFGYRRLTVLLRREGWKVNAKRVLRLYRLEALQVRTKRRKKRASESRLPLPIPQRPNELWTMDFMADRLATGERFRTLNVLDITSRECVGIAAARSFPSDRVTDCLDTWIGEHGKPAGIQVDNGTEFTSNHFDAWAYGRGIAVHFITPGRPTENGVIESFNGKLRDECLNANWFDTLDDARGLIESWRTDYNEQRPHSALGNIPPAQYVANLMEWASP